MTRLTVRKHQKRKARERRVLDQARQQSREYLEKTGDFSVVKWFHDRGVAQVIQTDKAFYTDRI